MSLVRIGFGWSYRFDQLDGLARFGTAQNSQLHCRGVQPTKRIDPLLGSVAPHTGEAACRHLEHNMRRTS